MCHAAYTGDEAFCPRDGGAIVAEAVDDDLIGKTIDGRYLVLELLGRGGMGKVYAAEHVGLGKRVAIKLISDADADRDQRARFRREARAASKIAHENVVQIFDVGVDDNRDYIAMEHVEGRDLDDVLRDGPMPIARAIGIARQLLRGLAAVHEAGIIHRDVKPGNVRVVGGGAVKLMDFGIAKPLRAGAASGGNVTRTDTGQVVGTPQFMAPEQFLDGGIDHRADLYAVGATLYTMLAGEYPFSADSFTQRIAAAAPRPIAELRDNVPGSIIAAVDRALARDPAERFADAAAFEAALAEGGDAVAAKQEAPTVRASQRRVDPQPAQAPAPAVGATRARSLVPVVIGLSVLLALATTLIVVLAVRTPETKQVAVVPADATATSVDVSSPTIDTAIASPDQAVALDPSPPLDAASTTPTRKPPTPIPTSTTPASGTFFPTGLPGDRKACTCQFKTETGSISGACVRKRDAYRCTCKYKGDMVCPQVITVVNDRARQPDGSKQGWMLCLDRTKPDPACDPLLDKRPERCSLYHVTQRAGIPADRSDCRGYVSGLTADDPQVTGKWSCSICDNALLAPAHIGKTGDTCTGFDGSTGKAVTGILRC